MPGKLAILRSLYLFLKEVILGKATLKEAFEYDRRRVIILGLIMASFTTNLVAVPSMVKLTVKSIEQTKEIKALKEELSQFKPPS